MPGEREFTNSNLKYIYSPKQQDLEYYNAGFVKGIFHAHYKYSKNSIEIFNLKNG